LRDYDTCKLALRELRVGERVRLVSIALVLVFNRLIM
jgi:hypothetical protein